LNILVVGGAGYIGSHMVKTLVEAGPVTTVFDSLVTGHRDAVHPAAKFVSGDISDRPPIDRLLARNFDGSLGERRDPETHLIPLALQAAARKRPAIEIYGDDCDTPGGTCIRDHVHLDDLCAAHLLALDHLVTGGGSRRSTSGRHRRPIPRACRSPTTPSPRSPEHRLKRRSLSPLLPNMTDRAKGPQHLP